LSILHQHKEGKNCYLIVYLGGDSVQLAVGSVFFTICWLCLNIGFIIVIRARAAIIRTISIYTLLHSLWAFSSAQKVFVGMANRLLPKAIFKAFD
jgi:hypothetical protein